MSRGKTSTNQIQNYVWPSNLFFESLYFKCQTILFGVSFNPGFTMASQRKARAKEGEVINLTEDLGRKTKRDIPDKLSSN